MKVLRQVPLFKSESEAKLPENVRFFQFAIYLLFSDITFLNNKSFLIPVDEIDDLCFFNMVGIYLCLMLLRLVSLFKLSLRRN